MLCSVDKISYYLGIISILLLMIVAVSTADPHLISRNQRPKRKGVDIMPNRYWVIVLCSYCLGAVCGQITLPTFWQKAGQVMGVALIILLTHIFQLKEKE